MPDRLDRSNETAAPADLRCEVTDTPSAEDAQIIEQGIYQHIREVTGYEQSRCAVLMRYKAGALVAGLTGSVVGKDLCSGRF